MNILNLARRLGIEVDELLASWRTGSLLIVRGQAREDGVGLLSNAVRLVDRPGLVGGVVLAVKVLEGRKEASRYASNRVQ